ncbi:MAG: efflux RND transporter periplasmic adaptor subunit [Geobacteraceae bacterium]|nr:efflux RND transporter periplasmic adaptor subunit [Geobacteraceae bacterium]
MKRKLFIAAVIMVILVAGILTLIRKPPAPLFKTAKIERGTLVSTVSATGSLAAVVTVQVGTQVSGTIQKLFVDFNSPVKRGQAIAQIDPALFIAKVEETKGNYLTSQANLEKAKADLADTRRNLERNRQLLKDGIISQADFDAAETKFLQAQAAAKAAEGNVSQNRGTYSQAQTNLEYATIKSPKDGIVVSRNVDVGQTVAASFQTPTLFTIAQDLTKMEINTSVDEADISKVKVGQPVSFTVDSYPDSKFTGTVTQIRNAPIFTQNVVTYIVIVGVDNKDLSLKPGMTANVTIETARRDNVLKIPSAALRFKPKTVRETKGKKQEESGSKKRDISPQVYVLGPEQTPVAVPVVTGISSDGQLELLQGELKENDEVIIEQLGLKKKEKTEQSSGGMPRGPGM